VTSTGLSYDRYQSDGHDEWVMGLGPPHAPPILFLPPLFEEMNRTRALIAGIMRLVAADGYSCWLPDLPGTGESLRPLERVSWEGWRTAVRVAAGQVSRGGKVAAVASFRGGALLDDLVPAHCVWRMAPVSGASLARDLERAGLTSGGGAAGYAPGELLLGPLQRAEPQDSDRLRTLRLASDRADADLKIDFPPLWRRAEPETSSELASLIAGDIMSWARQCDAS
jgi:pimeloyl-ACP methyl ester carboxylesterase